MNLFTILGPTATGKTRVAALLASSIDGEVISADSRQVYRKMDIGTGKDYADYVVNGKTVHFHLVDIRDAGEEYNVYEYVRDFTKAFLEITAKDCVPVLCGGSGLYIEAVLRGYTLINVPVNENLRAELEGKTLEELTAVLSGMKKLHNITDTVNKKRVLRAIEIEQYYSENPEILKSGVKIDPLVTGISFDRETVRQRITVRLKKRLESGMVEEVKSLLDSGIAPAKLIYYGLEYKYITLYLTGQLSFVDMFEKLNIAIHQFSKRQMTWFRRMERNGIRINWIDGNLPDETKVSIIRSLWEQPNAHKH